MSIVLHPTSRTPTTTASPTSSDACWPCATGADGDAAHAMEFLDRLCALPLTDWITAGELALRMDEDEARAALDRVVAERHLEVPAWYVRDAVATAIELAWCAPDCPPDHVPADRRWSLPAHSDVEQRRLDAAREAAERAALALVVRAWLPRAVFDALYAPFAEVVPLTG